MRWLAAMLLPCACSGGGGGGPVAAPPPATPLAGVEVAVSGLSPLPAGCGGTGGTAYVHAEVEPHLAVDPRDANHLLGAWQQDRWSNGSARGLLAGVSFDGGATWTLTQAPFSECTGGTGENGGGYVRVTDPWVAFGPDGTAWQAALATRGAAFAPSSANAMLVARSADGGRTWSAPSTLILDGGAFFNDKEALTADPIDARFVYVAWDRLDAAGHGPSWFARTVDGGATWEPARAIHDPGPGAQTIGNLVRVLPGGGLVNLFVRLVPDTAGVLRGELQVVRSGDRGATWSAPVTVASHLPLGTRDPASGRAIRDGSLAPQMAVAPGGALYVVWQDGRFTGARDAIALARSTDGGETWSAPVRVNADPAVAAFAPQVHVAADGTVGVTYYDLRSDTPDTATLPADFWLARSVDAATWTEARVAGPFDLALAPLAGGALFLGDYTGLASAGSTFLPFYARTTGNPLNPTDVFVARMPPAAPGIAYPAGDAKRAPETDAAFLRRVGENLRTSASLRMPAPTPSP